MSIENPLFMPPDILRRYTTYLYRLANRIAQDQPPHLLVPGYSAWWLAGSLQKIADTSHQKFPPCFRLTHEQSTGLRYEGSDKALQVLSDVFPAGIPHDLFFVDDYAIGGAKFSIIEDNIGPHYHTFFYRLTCTYDPPDKQNYYVAGPSDLALTMFLNRKFG